MIGYCLSAANQSTMRMLFDLYILPSGLWIIMGCVPWMHCRDGHVNHLSREGRPSAYSSISLPCSIEEQLLCSFLQLLLMRLRLFFDVGQFVFCGNKLEAPYFHMSFSCLFALRQMLPSWRTSRIQSVSQGHWTTLPASFMPRKTRRTISSTRLQGKWFTSNLISYCGDHFNGCFVLCHQSATVRTNTIKKKLYPNWPGIVKLRH